MEGHTAHAGHASREPDKKGIDIDHEENIGA
jgi:hypothetical protein